MAPSIQHLNLNLAISLSLLEAKHKILPRICWQVRILRVLCVTIQMVYIVFLNLLFLRSTNAAFRFWHEFWILFFFSWYVAQKHKFPCLLLPSGESYKDCQLSGFTYWISFIITPIVTENVAHQIKEPFFPLYKQGFFFVPACTGIWVGCCPEYYLFQVRKKERK